MASSFILKVKDERFLTRFSLAIPSASGKHEIERCVVNTLDIHDMKQPENYIEKDKGYDESIL